MDDAALVRVHGLEGAIAARLDRLVCDLFAEHFQGVLALLAVIADIKRNAEVRILNVVGHQAGQILERVERLPAVPDDKAHVLAGQGDQSAALLLLDVELHVGQPHIGEDVLQILRRSICGAVFDIGAHLCGIAPKKTECLFHGHFQNLEFCLVGLHAQLLACGLKGLFHRIPGSNCFFNHV